MQQKEKNPWKTLSVKPVYDNPWIKVEEHQVINPGGGKGIYGKIQFKNKALGIIPVDENDNTWLVGQYRYPIEEYSWEIPMGGGPLTEDILTAAQRELKEETGMKAGKWQEIIRIHMSNSVSDETGYVFLAEDLTAGERQLEESEADLKLWKLPFIEALEMVINGDITDSLSVAGILRAARMKGY